MAGHTDSAAARDGGWFRVPHALIEHMHEMPKSAVLTLLVLMHYADDQGQAWPSINTIQHLAGIRKRTTLWALAWLESNGFIKRTRRKTALQGNQSTVYELQPPWWASATREPTLGSPIAPPWFPHCTTLVPALHHLGSPIAQPWFPHCTTLVQPGNQEQELIEQESMNKKEGAPRRFVKPSVEEVAQYCASRGNDVDPQSFWDFYESKGWKVGNTPMKDWRAAVRTWERRKRQDGMEKGQSNVIIDKQITRFFSGDVPRPQQIVVDGSKAKRQPSSNQTPYSPLLDMCDAEPEDDTK